MQIRLSTSCLSSASIWLSYWNRSIFFTSNLFHLLHFPFSFVYFHFSFGLAWIFLAIGALQSLYCSCIWRLLPIKGKKTYSPKIKHNLFTNAAFNIIFLSLNHIYSHTTVSHLQKPTHRQIDDLLSTFLLKSIVYIVQCICTQSNDLQDLHFAVESTLVFLLAAIENKIKIKPNEY